MKDKLCILIFGIIFLASCSDDKEDSSLESAVEVEMSSDVPQSTIELSIVGVNTIVDWGDGLVQNLDNQGSTLVEHIYTEKGSYKIQVRDANLQSFGLEKNGNNIIKNVNFIKCPSLKFVRLLQAKKISNLNFSQCSSLQEVYITNGAMTSLDFTNNENLKSIKLLSSPELSTLNINNKVKILAIQSSPKLSIDKNLDLSKLTFLEELYLSNMSLISIKFSDNNVIKTLDLSSNNLLTLDVSKLSNLKNLNCSANLLESDALNIIYTALPSRTTADAAKITITDNSGASTSDVTIASKKNWEVVK